MNLSESASQELIRTASNKLDLWVESEKFRGWDPFDALESPFLSKLTFQRRIVGQIFVQLIRRLPINIRPLLRIKKGYNPNSSSSIKTFVLPPHLPSDRILSIAKFSSVAVPV